MRKTAWARIRTTGFMKAGRPGSAERALLENTDMSAEEIVRKAMKIAGDICIFTNHNIVVETV